MSINREDLEKLGEAPFVIGVDVGGTNARVWVKSLDQKHQFPYVEFKASSVAELLGELAVVGETLKRPPTAGCIAVAGPVYDEGNTCQVTNYQGTLAERTFSRDQLPKTLFPAGKSAIINDLEAGCYGVLALAKSGTLHEYFTPLWGPKGEIKLNPTPYAVLAAGTGLGVGLLSKRIGRAFEVIPLEGGHGLISPVGKKHADHEQERQLLEYLSLRLYEGKHQPEFEDIVSGRGISYCYDFLSRDDPKHKPLSTPEIVELAFANPHSVAALDAILLHYKYLLRCAQNICVILQTKGVFLAGDNQAANHPFVEKIHETLHKEFINHPKYEWLQNLPVYAQHVKRNLNVDGTLYVSSEISLK